MLHAEVVQLLREHLLEGRIAPGARIAERELCAAMNISRTPLREALKVLAAEGHVTLLPNRGARATRLTQADVRDLFEVSAALEAAAGELACQRITDDEIARLAATHAEMARHYAARDLVPYYACNRAIHEAIIRAAGNAVLLATYESIGARIRRARYIAPMTESHWQVAMQEHDAMNNALIRRDGVVLALILKTHLRHKSFEVERAGFAVP
ncbi:GntR family transcriptional regulator [Acidiphilium acidophilum]|jgi:DNA-binding GntR family transcriptional regulator|uniref:GntR family transcriptional regulator n=1 Tax=Acidiphilium acidophilum TaxID=76588 RepID=A0AAW9DUJ6_ACIAO|nr:GntR family transcriptional regulator [Acidiphilium acidophilum]MDX5932209.1 GntR family transcriptional regulator [Acidiphilium acidophilum]GBQ13452.1 GntR family transcriptional regulator [Acidiphilium acidophilum DSM 700]